MDELERFGNELLTNIGLRNQKTIHSWLYKTELAQGEGRSVFDFTPYKDKISNFEISNLLLNMLINKFFVLCRLSKSKNKNQTNRGIIEQ